MPIADRFEKNAYIQIGKMSGVPLVSLLFAALFMVSCGFGNSQSSSIGGGQSRSGTMETDIGLDELRELARPPELGGETVQSTGVRTVNGEFRDLNQRTLLFEQNIRNTDDRLDRIENAVQDLSDDFRDVEPAIQRLVAIENDLRELYDQLSLLINGSEQDSNVADEDFEIVAPEISPAEPVQLAPEPVAQPVQTSNTRTQNTAVPVSSDLPNIRAADYADKTRIVFETDTKQTFTSNFDPENQLLVIGSPITFPQPVLDKIKRSSKNIVDITSTAKGDGVDIAIMTKGITQADKSAYIGATSSNKNYRYYIDIAK